MLVWDVTCPDTLVPSYAALSMRETGVVAAEIEWRKRKKYEQGLITGYYTYQPSTPKCFRRLEGRSPIDGNR